MSGVEFDRAGVAAHAKNLANKVKGGLEGSLKTLGVEVVDATGELAGANTVKAVETGKTFTAKDIILAPGSLPFVPPGVQVTSQASYCCTTVWKYVVVLLQFVLLRFAE